MQHTIPVHSREVPTLTPCDHPHPHMNAAPDATVLRADLLEPARAAETAKR